MYRAPVDLVVSFGGVEVAFDARHTLEGSG